MNLKKLKHLLIVKKDLIKLKLIYMFYLRAFGDLLYLIFIALHGFYFWKRINFKKII